MPVSFFAQALFVPFAHETMGPIRSASEQADVLVPLPLGPTIDTRRIEPPCQSAASTTRHRHGTSRALLMPTLGPLTGSFGGDVPSSYTPGPEPRHRSRPL